MLRKFVLSVLLVSTAGNAYAQTQNVSSGQAEKLDEIIVQAVRRDIPVQALPNTIRLMGTKALREQELISTSLVDIVGARIPSFSPSRQKLSGHGESFRGREPLYMIDSVPQSNPLRNGSRDGFTIDSAVVEHVEIIFGANAIQGVGATGGVINYVTVKAQESEDWQFNVEASVTGNNNLQGDGFGYRGAVTAMRDFGDFDFVASIAGQTQGAYYDAQNRRIGTDYIQGDLQDSHSMNYFAKAGWDIDPQTRLQVFANIFKLSGEGDYKVVAGSRVAGRPASSIRTDDFEGEAATNNVSTFSIDFNREDVFGGTFSAQGFHRSFEAIFGGGTFGGYFNVGDEPDGVFTFDQSANNSNKTGIKLTYSHGDLGIDGLTVTGGLDVLSDNSYQELIHTGRLWVPEMKFVSFAPFLQIDQMFFDDRILISGGLRHESATLKVADFVTLHNADDTAVNGGEPSFGKTLFNLGGSFEVVDGAKIYASYAQGFTMPDVGRVLRAINTPGLSVESLLSVEPVVADNLEFGVSFERGAFSTNASYFISESDFGVRLVPDDAGFLQIKREPTKIDGFEASADFEISDTFSIGANFAVLKGKSDQDGDGNIDEDLGAENISPNRANIYADWQVTPKANMRVQLSNYASKTFNDGTDKTDFEGHSLIDFSAGYDFDKVGRVDLGVQNAFNKDYITYYSQSGAGIAIYDGFRYFAGRGRTYTLRWSAKY